MFDAPADVAFLCRTSNELTEVEANALVASGCKTVVDGGYRPVSTAAAEVRTYATATVAVVVAVVVADVDGGGGGGWMWWWFMSVFPHGYKVT